MTYNVASLTPDSTLKLQLDAFKALCLSTNPQFIQRCNSAQTLLTNLTTELNYINAFDVCTPATIKRKRAITLVLKHATALPYPPTSDVCAYIKLKTALKKLNDTTPCPRRLPPLPRPPAPQTPAPTPAKEVA